MAKHVDTERPVNEESPVTEALYKVRKLYLQWEQEFTGTGKLHDVVQGHVTDLRNAIESELGEDWPY